jgi:hypothetical protein
MVNQNGKDEAIRERGVGTAEEEEQQDMAFDFNHTFEDMDWWPELADLDRLNILSSPKEDRARLLASKYSKPVAEILIIMRILKCRKIRQNSSP